MTTRTKKRTAWWMMTGGFGAALLFGIMMIFENRWPRASDWWVYLWPSGGVLFGVAGLLWLRRLFHIEPPQAPAAWTVTLTDLIIATVVAGICSAILMRLDGYEQLMPVVGLLVFALYVHGALAASLNGVFGTRRIPFAVANIGLTLGVMGWMTMGILSILLGVMGEFHDLFRFWNTVLFRWTGERWVDVVRGCVFALPVGAVLMALVRWRTRAAAE